MPGAIAQAVVAPEMAGDPANAQWAIHEPDLRDLVALDRVKRLRGDVWANVGRDGWGDGLGSSAREEREEDGGGHGDSGSSGGWGKIRWRRGSTRRGGVWVVVLRSVSVSLISQSKIVFEPGVMESKRGMRRKTVLVLKSIVSARVRQSGMDE
jgi:hypothetical protein